MPARPRIIVPSLPFSLRRMAVATATSALLIAWCCVSGVPPSARANNTATDGASAGEAHPRSSGRAAMRLVQGLPSLLASYDLSGLYAPTLDTWPADTVGFSVPSGSLLAPQSEEGAERFHQPDYVPALRQHGGRRWLRLEGLHLLLQRTLPAPSVSLSSTVLFSEQATAWALPLAINQGIPSPEPLRLNMPPVFTAALGLSADALVFGGVDYRDPRNVGVPLVYVEGYEDVQLSPHFRVGDFATRDGAPYARIAPSLVQSLEQLQAAAGPLVIISGYRHLTYNAAVDGVYGSRHMSGQAVDLYSPTRSSLELAHLAIRVLGCTVGLGLGANTLHLDVRGRLATWTYPGAPLSEGAFDLWTLSLCQGHQGLPLSAAEIYWLEANVTEDTTFVAADWLREHQAELMAYADSARAAHGTGAILIDLRDGAPPPGAPLGSTSRFVAWGSPEAVALNVDDLITWVRARRDDLYYAYAVLLPDGMVQTGVGGRTPPPVTEEPAAVQPGSTADRIPTAPRDALGTGAAARERWGIVVASTTDSAEADRLASAYRSRLSEASLPVIVYTLDDAAVRRYRVVVGRFASAQSAGDARAARTPILPEDAWLLKLSE